MGSDLCYVATQHSDFLTMQNSEGNKNNVFNSKLKTLTFKKALESCRPSSNVKNNSIRHKNLYCY